MQRQQGVTLTGMIVVLFLLVVVALLGFKVMPSYMQYMAIQKTFKTLAQNPALRSGNRKEIVGAYQRQASIDDLKDVAEEDIEVTKEGGQVVISAKYYVKVPLVANVSLLIDFAPSSAAK